MASFDVVLPFKTVEVFDEDSGLVPHEWQWRDSTSEPVVLENKTSIEDWSYTMDLTVSRALEMDPEAIREFLGLPDGAGFELVFSLIKGPLGRRTILERWSLHGQELVEQTFRKTLASRDLAEEITLVSSLLLATKGTGGDPGSPSQKGSRLWEDRVNVVLEGSGGRFPMQDVDFSADPHFPSEAAWHLEWRPELLDYSFNSAVTLFINSSRDEFFGRILDGDAIILEQVMSGIVSEICAHLLHHDDFFAEHPQGSLGQVVQSWLAAAFPNTGLDEVKQVFLRSPHKVHTRLRDLSSRLYQ